MNLVVFFFALGLPACSSSNTTGMDLFEVGNATPNTAQGDARETADLVSFHELARHRGHVDHYRPPYAIDDKWRQSRLTWCLYSATTDLDEETQIEIISDGITQWMNEANLVIGRQESCSDADIQVEFISQGDAYYESLFGDSVDQYDSTLGSTALPGDDVDKVYLTMDDEKVWTDEYRTSSDSPFDLATVMIHEIGHALGMLHSSDSSAVMAAYYGGSQRNLRDDDIAGIQANYGESQGFCIDGYTLASLPYYEMWAAVGLAEDLVNELSGNEDAENAQEWVDYAYHYSEKSFSWAYEAAYSGPAWAAGTNYYQFLTIDGLELSSGYATDAYFDTGSDNAWDLYWSVLDAKALTQSALDMIHECHVMEYGEDPCEW